MEHFTVTDDATAVVAAPKTTRRSRRTYADSVKRIFDIVVSLMLLPLVVPLVAIMWLLVRRDGGPGFYAHARVGLKGEEFNCWKLRSMVVDADGVLQRLIESDPAVAEEWHRDQKLADDPRITRIGNFLRKTSLDELPQLLNVLRGEMSLVGPRPFTPDQKYLYDRLGASGAYYLVRPGITGLWQVECRNDGEFLRRVDYDAMYERDLSFLSDLRILVKTVSVVLKRTGG